MRSRVMCLVMSVCVCVYMFVCVSVCVVKKLAVLGLTTWKSFECTFSLSVNASSVVCYTQRAVQTVQFMLFQIRQTGPPAPKCFLSSIHTPHPLLLELQWYRLVVCFSKCFSSCAMTATLLYMYAAAIINSLTGDWARNAAFLAQSPVRLLRLKSCAA